MKKILVIGGMGFIGKALSATLISKGYEVDIVDFNSIEDDNEFLKLLNIKIIKRAAHYYLNEIMTSNMIPIIQDLTGNKSFKYDAIFDLATEQPNSDADLNKLFSYSFNNFIVPTTCLQYCQHNPKTKYIYISDGLVKSDALLNSDNPYILNKKQAEETISVFRKIYYLNACSVRLFEIYGPGEYDSGYKSTLAARAKNAYFNNLDKIELYNRDFDITNYLHVQDAVDGLISIMNIGVLKTIYELGGHNIEQDEILQSFFPMSIKTVDNRSFDLEKSILPDPNLYPPDWIPTSNIREYIDDLIA